MAQSPDQSSSTPITVTTITADYHNPEHRRHLLALLNHYAQDPMGMDAPLPNPVQERVLDDLAAFPTSFSILAYNLKQPVGLLNAFWGYSTFKGKPLANIHDIVVLPEFRSRGIGNKLLEAVEKKAVERGCCKITLEVREDNPAKKLYSRFGFSDDTPPMYFWSKEL